MTVRVVIVSSIVTLCSALSGCKTLEQTIRPDADKIAAFPLTHRTEVERIDLAQLIHDEANLRCHLDHRNLAQLDENANVNFAGRRVDQALGCFNEFARNTSYAAVTRNQIQERLLAASEQRCADFKALLQRKQSDTNFFTGLATAAFAAAGSITTSVEGARTLAGLSGLSSAYGAEYNQAYFSNLASHVIVAGIELQRTRIYEQIAARGQSKSINDYPLQAAIKDAFRFHGACSIMAGLVQAQEAIKTVENPGLGTLQRAITKNKFLQALNKAEPADVPSTLAAWKDVVPSDAWLAGIPITHTTTVSLPDAPRLPIQVQQTIASATSANAALATLATKVLKARAGDTLLSASEASVNAATTRFKLLTDSLGAVAATCTTRAMEKAKDSIQLAAALAAAPDERAAEKLNVDMKFLGREADAIAAVITSRAFAITSCDRELRIGLNELAAVPKDDDARTIAANALLKTKTDACLTSVAAIAECK